MNALPKATALRKTGAVDWTLYVVTESLMAGERSLAAIIEAAIRGGARVIQYREKTLTTRQMVESAAGLCQLCQRLGAVFLVNDRLDVALAVNADGVHLGQNDMPARMARKLVGPEKLLGVSVQDTKTIDEAENEGADYLSFSPVFATPTKPDHEEPLGLEGLRVLARRSRLPTVAIGGINRTNVADVMRAGVQGVCVISAVIGAPDPERAARELYQLARAAREELEHEGCK
jgi:thiamine-phosphate pyrophosphorylase